MNTTMKKIIVMTGILAAFACNAYPRVKVTDNKVRIYNHPMNPRQHPDDNRRYVKPPDAGTFNNQIQFMALRSLDDNYMESLDNYTVRYGLGDIIWPSYPLLYRDDLNVIVDELKRRNLYLFDLWGYVPGSGPGGYWQQFVVPQKSLELFEKVLGDRWLGMDNGEQDGRYVGGFAGQMSNPGDVRENQYLNFQNHFQGLTDRLGNKMATLVSLNFGHYFLKEGVYTLIGAETAQGLPNGQVYYSFIRGAGKQYGVPWFGNASVWNRWGWKNYSGITSDNGGDTKGTSLSLLKRLIYSHIMYDCVAVGFESSFLNQKEELSPIGKIQQSAVQWVKEHGDPGHLHTPVAVMTDFFSGWSFPRHLYTGNIYRVWGNLPYEEGDYLTDGLMDLFYPGYRDASYFHDETGFITSTPYGDITDCLLSDAPLWVLQQYPVLIVGDRLRGGYELKDKLESYIETGGHLVITAGSLANIPGGLAGFTTGNGSAAVKANSTVRYRSTEIIESQTYLAREIIAMDDALIIAACKNTPLAYERSVGPGSITVFTTPYGIGSEPVGLSESGIDKPLTTPFPLLDHVKTILGDIVQKTEIFRADEGLSLITCTKGNGEYTIAIANNSWNEKSFRITPASGKIIEITELPLDCSEQNAIGYLPESVVNSTGKNSETTIAGGDIRIFAVKTDDAGVEYMPFKVPVPNPVKRGLTLRNTGSLKREILLRPTFFQHFDHAVIDWKYLLEKETRQLAVESEWIKRQGLKIIVDFSSGINLFPDLRLVNNDEAEYQRSIDAIKSVIDKMSLLGATDLILTTHRTIENNFSREEFDTSFRNTIRDICRVAAEKDIYVNMKMTTNRNMGNLLQTEEFVRSVGVQNLYTAPSAALILSRPDAFEKDIAHLKEMKYRLLFVSAPERDMYGTLWNINSPVSRYADAQGLQKILSLTGESTLIMDGLYLNQDEEYLDLKTIENLTTGKTALYPLK
jgi:hypothetical protein